MSDEKNTLRRVQDALFHLQKGLGPFVEANMQARHGARWLHFASRSAGGCPTDPLDVYGQLKTIIDNWRDVFEPAFDRKTGNQFRNRVSTAFEARNATSHLSLPLTDSDALVYLSAIRDVLQLAKAVQTEQNAVKALYEEQRTKGVAAPPPPAPPAPQQLSLDHTPSVTLRPWVEVALPHPDVLANRFREAEFAADLFAVDAGLATEDYATPENFYRITFLTEGLQRVLTSALQRLSRVGGDPVIGLQTAFGGGKTHTMLAVYHLCGADDISTLHGMSALMEKAGVKSWVKPKVAAFVGSSKGTDVSLNMRDGPKVHTLWGYIAWRLAGDAGLKLVQDAENARTNPGSELMVEVLKLAGPSLILLDEVVLYARQLDGDRFEAFLSFIQSLTEAVKLVPGCLIVGSLPESDAEAGGEKGMAALARLERVFGRVQSPWLPASGVENYEIIRRRLFQQLDSEGEKAREETVKAFYELYRRNAAEFPPEAREPRYQELLRIAYPIHPELFERLRKDWASLPNFQRTRGVLRFMANVVGVLWHAQSKDVLITPGRVPIAHERVRASVLYPLDPGFGAVVDREVDGEGSLAARMEANPSRRLSQARAATRAARAVFMCSAPLVGQPNAGVNGPGLRLACAEPGDQLAIFGEALRELSERATYLYEEAGRYWFSTQPTLNRLADDLARGYAAHEVDAAITDILKQDGLAKGNFARVHVAPDDVTSVDEAPGLSLVILRPEATHAGKGVVASPAVDAVTEGLTRCRTSQRRFRNMLVFVAADDASLATAREVVRKSMAWQAITRDTVVQQKLTKGQADDADTKARGHRDAAQKAVRAAWSHIFIPVRSETPGKPFDLEHHPINSRDRAGVPATVYDKLKADSAILERLGPDRLWLALQPIWPGDRPYIPISELFEWFQSYVYMPKIRDRVALEQAVRDAVAKLDAQFGYADGYSEGASGYLKPVMNRTPPDEFPAGAVIIARSAFPAEPDPTPMDARPPIEAPGPGKAVPATPATTAPTAAKKPSRFFGSVEIDAERPVKAFDAIVSAVVMELQRNPNAKVKITIDIEATAPDGFSDADVGVVRDNARQLKFKPEATGFDD